MEQKGFKWQIIVEAVILLFSLCYLFMPVMRISGDDYIKMAVEVNKQAKEEDEKKAKEAGANDMVKKYKKGSDKREKEADKYQDEIDDEDSDSISAIKFCKWAFTVDKDDLQFKGIEMKKDKKLSKSSLKDKYVTMAVLLIIPAVVILFNLIFLLLDQRTRGYMLCVTGAVALICGLIWRYSMPGSIWDAVSSYVKSFTLIDKDVLAIKGVGKFAIQEMFKEFTGIGIYVQMVFGGILVAVGLLFATALKPQGVLSEEDLEVPFPSEYMQMNGMPPFNPVGGNGLAANPGTGPGQLQGGGQPFHQPGMLNGHDSSALDDTVAFTEARMEMEDQINSPAGRKGRLRGVAGEYAGTEIELRPGEEILIGRDPKICTLVLKYPKASRKHCGVRYDEAIGKYQVKDYSSTGTELSNGSTVPKGTYLTVDPGTVIYLAGKHEGFALE